jgi:hypothetical protein
MTELLFDSGIASLPKQEPVIWVYLDHSEKGRKSTPLPFRDLLKPQALLVVTDSSNSLDPDAAAITESHEGSKRALRLRRAR